MPDLFKVQEAGGPWAARSRPLAAKLEVLLDLLFRKIVYDPSQPGSTDWTTDSVLRTLRKQDKDLGN